ncbi:MAG: zinc ribbon domain-containing protein [Nitrospiraceae bacterium]|nr:zinc ribbon domain-containing protein [Nitrospiraceae bacterium]
MYGPTAVGAASVCAGLGSMFAVLGIVLPLLSLACAVLFFIAGARIIEKAGYKGKGIYILISLVPIVNLYAVWKFANADWPALQSHGSSAGKRDIVYSATGAAGAAVDPSGNLSGNTAQGVQEQSIQPAGQSVQVEGASVENSVQMGRPVQEEVEKKIFCINCGKQNSSRSRFCVHCGKPLPKIG